MIDRMYQEQNAVSGHGCGKGGVLWIAGYFLSRRRRMGYGWHPKIFMMTGKGTAFCNLVPKLRRQTGLPEAAAGTTPFWGGSKVKVFVFVLGKKTGGVVSCFMVWDRGWGGDFGRGDAFTLPGGGAGKRYLPDNGGHPRRQGRPYGSDALFRTEKPGEA